MCNNLFFIFLPFVVYHKKKQISIILIQYIYTNYIYIVNYIKSPLGYSELTKYMKSTAQPSISMAALRDMLVPLPSLKEQEAIIKKIEEISILKNNIR